MVVFPNTHWLLACSLYGVLFNNLYVNVFRHILIAFISTGIDLRNNHKRKCEEAGITGEDCSTLVDHMSNYLLQSKADSTVAKYKNSFAAFEKFCVSKNIIALPALSISVALYMTHLMDLGKSDNVVSSAIYGIKWAHDLNDFNDPTERKTVKLLLNTAKHICSKPVVKKDVLSSEMIQDLCLTFKDSSDVIELRDMAMIMLAYSGFLRISEVCNLRCNDVTFNVDHVVLKIRQSKTDMYRKGADVVISKGATIACPLTILQRYVNKANLSLYSDEFLFKPAFKSKNKTSLIKTYKKLSYTR